MKRLINIIKPAKNNKGIALVVTLAVATLLMAVVVELNKKVRTSVISSAAARDRYTLTYMAQSGIHIGMALLMKDIKEDIAENKFIDTVLEDWSDPEKVAEAVAEVPFEEGEITVTITDELGKIQVNALVDYPKGRQFNNAQKMLWDRFLRPVVSLDDEAELNATADIINSVKDWLDFGDDDAITGVNGAESDYYQGLEPPYSARNGPFTHLSELLLVKDVKPEYLQGMGTAKLQGLAGGALQGIDPSMLEGLGSTMASGLIQQFQGEMSEDLEELSLEDLGISTQVSDFMTVYGMETVKENQKVDGRSFTFPGNININTTGIQVLAAILPAGSEYLAPAIYEYRKFDPELDEDQMTLLKLAQQQSEKNIPAFTSAPDLSKPGWYSEVTGEVKIDSNIIEYKTNFFRIVCTATLNNMKLTLTTVVHRFTEDENLKNFNKWQCKVLSWEVK